MPNSLFDYSSMTTHELGLRKFNLETALVEEEFHYNSISVRKSWTKSDMLFRLLLLIPVTLIFLGCITILLLSLINLITSYDSSCENTLKGISAISILLLPLVAIPTGILSYKLWSQHIYQFSLLFGRKNKAGNFGSKNFNDERKNSEKSILSLRAELNDVTEALKEKYKNPPVIKASLEDDLYAYAIGTYGEDSTTIKIKKEHGIYLKEKSELEKDIQEDYSRIRSLGNQRNDVLNNYLEAKERFMNGICIIMIIIGLTTILSSVFTSKALTICFAAMIICILLLVYFYNNFKMPQLFYGFEFDSEKYADAKESYGYMPTGITYKKIKAELSDKQKRLEYIERVLSET